MMRLFPTLLLFTILAASPTTITAQDFSVAEDDKWCDREHHHDGYEYCEVRETRLSALRELEVDAAPNGGISVRAWDKDEVLLRVKVTASAESEERAGELARRISISTRGTIEADGPRSDKDEWFSVSYEIYAPRSTDLDLESQNGGITIEGMTGKTRFSTQNGGVTLSTLAGDVEGETTNGGLTVELDGKSWEGAGLDVQTTNGGISIVVPSGYSAELETGTVNGRIKVDFPVMVEGTFDKRLNATLGEGGKTIRAVTTNGSVRIKRG
jgi:DUF4097 and DUF4098 domain-containing protein YvlB